MVYMKITSAENFYLHDRGISEEVAQNAGLHWETRGAQRLVIPIKNSDGKEIFSKYRRNPNDEKGVKYTYDKGTHSALFGVETITPMTETVYICEGELDALCLRSQIGSATVAAVSSTGGCGVWKEEWNEHIAGKAVVIVYDTDRPGVTGALKLCSQIPESVIGFIAQQFPFQPKDITEIFQKFKSKAKFLEWWEKLHEERLEIPLGAVTMKDKNVHQDYWMAKVQEQNKTKDQFYWPHIALEYVNSMRVYETVKRNEILGRDGDTDIQKAKLYPISDMVKFNHFGKAHCLWHTEKSPSMYYYAENNTVYCFGCSKHGDSIDVFQALNHVTFKEAVKIINEEKL